MDAGTPPRGCGLEQRAPGAEALRLAIGAIFKNEGPYILEWVAYHRALGIDRFRVADNGSDDGSTGLLAALDRAGVVDHIPFPGAPGQPPQLPAYAEILRRHGPQADWIAFIDADEFLWPAPPLRSLRPVLAALDRLPGVGAVAVNWAIYGSAGHEQARPGLVIERFPARARHESPSTATTSRSCANGLSPSSTRRRISSSCTRVQPGTWVTGLTDDMGDTILPMFSSAVAVAAVDPVGNAQRCPQVHQPLSAAAPAGRRDA